MSLGKTSAHRPARPWTSGAPDAGSRYSLKDGAAGLGDMARFMGQLCSLGNQGRGFLERTVVDLKLET
ncbi:hypothetical protein, partial [Nitrospira sp. BLG_2]|uniref:hypothetical protein n=1 Tax=Nitrospira sp. BLG_2 TaxID=3397507 RepID=UPI003B9E8A45